jgi:hypothetical protein
MTDDPIERYVRLVLAGAQKDRATELQFDADAVSVRYMVEGTWHPFSPTPKHIIVEAILAYARMAGIEPAALPAEGKVDIVHSGMRLKWDLFWPAKHQLFLTPAK